MTLAPNCGVCAGGYCPKVAEQRPHRLDSGDPLPLNLSRPCLSAAPTSVSCAGFSEGDPQKPDGVVRGNPESVESPTDIDQGASTCGLRVTNSTS